LQSKKSAESQFFGGLMREAQQTAKMRNRGKLASAIAYDPGEGIPKVTASGRGREAERIIETARKAGVAIVEDSALAFLLDAGVKPGEFIPARYWEAVARILAFILKKEKNEDYSC
jgi:type III secretion system FlhB-like substrate exporter